MPWQPSNLQHRMLIASTCDADEAQLYEAVVNKVMGAGQTKHKRGRGMHHPSSVALLPAIAQTHARLVSLVMPAGHACLFVQGQALAC